MLLPEKNISFEEFLKGLKELQVMSHLRFRRSQSRNPNEHDLIFLVFTKEPKNSDTLFR